MQLTGRQTQFYIDLIYGGVFAAGFGALLIVGMDARIAAFQGGLVLGYFLRVWENMSVYERILREEVAAEAKTAVADEAERAVAAEAEQAVADEAEDAAAREVAREVAQQVPGEVTAEIGARLPAEVTEEVEKQLTEEITDEIRERLRDQVVEHIEGEIEGQLSDLVVEGGQESDEGDVEEGAEPRAGPRAETARGALPRPAGGRAAAVGGGAPRGRDPTDIRPLRRDGRSPDVRSPTGRRIDPGRQLRGPEELDLAAGRSRPV